MRPTTLALIAGILAGLTNPRGSFSAERAEQQPTLASPQTTGQPVEERLDRLELQVRLIQEHLGMRLRLPPTTSDAEAALGDQQAEHDRLKRLVDELQRQLEAERARSRATPAITQGRLVVQNMTGVPHYLSVNTVQYYVQPGRTDIWVPYQQVEAYLPWHESPKLLGMSLWKWTGRDYEMPLDIRN